MGDMQLIEGVDRDRVKAAHDQSARPVLWRMGPHVKVFVPETHRRIQGYKLDDLRDALVEVSLDAYKRGQQPAAEVPTREVDVTITETHGFQSPTKGQTTDVSFDDRFAYFEKKSIIGLDLCDRQMDLKVATLLTDTAVFSTETWTGTGKLSTRASDHTPDLDINNKLQSVGVRSYEGQLSDLEMVAIMHSEVMRALQGYVVYSGRGVASLKPTIQEMDDFRQSFGVAHGIKPENIMWFDAVYNASRRGVTTSRAVVGNGLLWIGLVSKQKSFDLTTNENTEGPDGAWAVAVSDEPWLHSFLESAATKESHFAAVDAKPYAPRDSSDSIELGIFFPASENI